MITILLSELSTGFLREQFTGDLRERRLAARDAAYRRDVPEAVSARNERQWAAIGRRARHRGRDDAAVCAGLPGSMPAQPAHTGIRLTRCWVYAQPSPTKGDRHERGNRGTSGVSASSRQRIMAGQTARGHHRADAADRRGAPHLWDRASASICSMSCAPIWRRGKRPGDRVHPVRLRLSHGRAGGTAAGGRDRAHRRNRGNAEAEGLRASAGIVGYCDFRLGEPIDAVLEAHIEAGGGRFKGIRQSAGWDAAVVMTTSSPAPQHLLMDPAFRTGWTAGPVRVVV